MCGGARRFRRRKIAIPLETDIDVSRDFGGQTFVRSRTGQAERNVFSCRIHSLDAKTFYLCNVTNFRKLIFFAVLAIVRNGMAAPPDTNIDSLIEYAAAQSRKGNFEEVVAAAGRLRALGRMGDDKARLYGLIYTGHVLAREVNDSVKLYYGRARDLALAAKDYRALTAIDNALAIYTSEMEMNYLGGLSYFMEALKYAELSPDKQAYPVVLNNIAMAHYLRNDPNGLKYSLQVVDIGTANGDPLLLYSGSFVTAYMYYLQGDPATALRYIETALAVGGNYIEYAEAYSLYANILAGLGRKSEAERYYKRAVAHVGSEKSNTLAYLNYGSYLMGERFGRSGHVGSGKGARIRQQAQQCVLPLPALRKAVGGIRIGGQAAESPRLL